MVLTFQVAAIIGCRHSLVNVQGWDFPISKKKGSSHSDQNSEQNNIPHLYHTYLVVSTAIFCYFRFENEF